MPKSDYVVRVLSVVPFTVGMVLIALVNEVVALIAVVVLGAVLLVSLIVVRAALNDRHQPSPPETTPDS
jgi:energy-converting hydrogenase Eha subunit E